MEYEIITRAEAKEQGLTHYFTGIPCRHGHLSLRYTQGASCTTCHSIGSKRYARENPQKVKSMIRERNLQNLYGISTDEYQDMLERQGGVCLVCLEECNRGTRLCVDHCHKTGEVRGLLCSRCNSALGNLRDDPEIIKSLLRYIRRFPSQD